MNKSFSGLVWSNSYEHALHFRDFYGPQSSTTDEVATAYAPWIDLRTTAA